jgi:hypothetical protein
VAEKVHQVGIVSIFEEVCNALGKIPMMSRPTVDIVSHVTQKALDGLFYMMGQQETKIRTDKLARVGPLMDKVFDAATTN